MRCCCCCCTNINISKLIPAHAPKQVSKLIVDPPRSGAMLAFQRLMEHKVNPERIVYVSCNPESLAVDLAYLQSQNYGVKKLRTADMFPNTSHIESIALLERRP